MPESEPLKSDMTSPDLSRIVVVGSSGSGKSTLASRLALRLDIPHVEFDSYRHGPNWTETPDELFRELVGDALKGESWIADGNYSMARDVVWPRATTIVWLDYPMPIILWRLFWRTMHRGILRVELWNGNREKLWWHFFSKNSLFLWVFQTHWKRRKSLPPVFEQPQYSHLDIIRFRSTGATKRWLKEIRKANL